MAAMVGIWEMPIMTTTFARYGKAKRAQQLGLTAVTFLMLSIWIGPDRACFFILIAAALNLVLAHSGRLFCAISGHSPTALRTGQLDP